MTLGRRDAAAVPASAEPRLAIVGTAGHIDHGKTALVRRLTGVDTDRLPEEKKRGISIDLGFAPLVTPAGVRVGIVDVPGHERFVKNMLAGAGGVDVVLLVIAADEGVMPQTREHLAIVRLLGVTRGIVVLTKRDLVEAEWAELVAREVQELLAGTALAGAPTVEFSAVSGRGTTELLAELDRQLESLPGRATDDAARLPIDRVFSVEGFGTVVTGTLWRGRVRVGDTLALEPRGVETRVRRVQVHGATVDEARAGQRTAIAVHGVDRNRVDRGDWLVSPGSLVPSSVLDVRFELLEDYPREWRSNQRVRFHLGASEILGRLVLLEGEERPIARRATAEGEGETAGTRRVLRPGASALAQLRLERPTVAARGDRFVIRSYSPARTVGGGAVIEPAAARRRRQAEGLDRLAVHETGSIEARLLDRLATDSKSAATAVLAQAIGEPEAATLHALERLHAAREIVSPAKGRWLSNARWSAARDAIAGTVRDYASRHAARFGIPKGELKSGLKTQIDPALFDAAFEALAAEPAFEIRADRVRPVGSPWEPPVEAQRALERLEAELEAAGYSVPECATWMRGFAHAAGGGAAGAAQASEVALLGLFLGRLVRVSQDLVYTTRQMEDLRRQLASWFDRHPTLNVAGFKELTGVSRKYAVPLLEHTDRVGWTVRVGDERKRGRV